MNKSETQLINQIKDMTQSNSSNVVLGIGDDCAVLDFNENFYQIVSTDILIEDIHFDLESMSMMDVGYKAMAVNVSDIAAMGGLPETVLISLGIPEELTDDDLVQLYSGINRCAEMFNVSVVGGDISKSTEFLIINITIIGKVEKDHVLYRKNAKDKDKVFVTGALGASLIQKHYSFTPCIKQGRFLALNNIASAMIDISDGVIKDLGEILKNSSLKGAVIDQNKIPISEDCKRQGSDEADYIEYALGDGEDFELLFTVSADNVDKLAKADFDVYEIGYIDNNLEGICLKDGNNFKQINFKGFEHF